jgi:hypothetical protein
MPNKVYRDSFEKAIDKLPAFDDPMKHDVIFMVCQRPVYEYNTRAFTPSEPTDPPYLKFQRNYETQTWVLIDEIELVD